MVAKNARKSSDRLAAYRGKRSAERTSEPFRSTPASRARAGLFVVQKHAARRMHYDFRIELDGVLVSWAVPKGPSLDPTDKRLAVHVEDHPLDYADFEGLIPEGNYGAGAVIVWDIGRWEAVEDPRAGMVNGKLLFDLFGYKLRGRWTIFRTKGEDGKAWLMMKKPDAAASKIAPPEQSVRSGRTVEELRDGIDVAAGLRKKIARRKLDPWPGITKPEPMLAQPREKPFSRPGWLFEIKYDGYRLFGLRDGERVELRYRRGSDSTAAFPEVADAIRALPYRQFVVDGELVVLDEEGRPSFQRLQERVHLKREDEIRRAAFANPVTYFVFDFLAFEGKDLRSLPLAERKALLRELVPPAGPLRFCDHVEERGEAMFEAAQRMGLEGIVAKRADSPYRPGRSEAWIKIRADRVGDFAVVGYSPPEGSRSGFGALHVACREGDSLRYAGRVGSGFTGDDLSRLHAALDAERRPDPPCLGEVPKGRGHVWVEPTHVVEVRYKERTRDGQLRQPVFLRERTDKAVEDCERQDAVEPEAPDPPPEPEAIEPNEHEVTVTNAKKVFWPDEGYTKGDLVAYYRSIAPWLLPYLDDRPLVLTRYPDGIQGKSFFQKDAPGFVPDWIRTERMWSEHAQREIAYFVCECEAGLAYLANLGTIPLHLWSSRVATLANPDWCILDLDPKTAPFAHVIEIAQVARGLCDEIGLPSYVKTSGSTGLHVLLPLDGGMNYEQSRRLGEILARVIVGRLPKIATIVRSPALRRGRVYVDYVQNGHGRLIVAPFSVRALPGAPVSMPLTWDEVRPGLDLRSYTLADAVERMERLGEDPLLGVLAPSRPRMDTILAKLAQKLGEAGSSR
jgi:bifunctional non-homologous end joining protein LigD